MGGVKRRSQSGLHLHSPFHQDLPWFLEDLLVQLGQEAPVKQTFTALVQKKKRVSQQQLLPLVPDNHFFSADDSGISSNTQLVDICCTVFHRGHVSKFQGCIRRCLQLPKPVSFMKTTRSCPLVAGIQTFCKTSGHFLTRNVSTSWTRSTKTLSTPFLCYHCGTGLPLAPLHLGVLASAPPVGSDRRTQPLAKLFLPPSL